MIEIKIPKEITEYKEKFLFGLTVRQFFSVAVALAVCVPLYIFGKDYIGDDGAGWLVLLIASPIFGFGFVKFNGMNFEQLLMVLWRQKWKEPQKRKYIELPVFWNFREEMNANELAKQRDYLKYATRKAEAAQKAAKSNKRKRKNAEMPIFWDLREEMNANELAKRRDFLKYSEQKAAAAQKAAK